jgi:hypothetical protein
MVDKKTLTSDAIFGGRNRMEFGRVLDVAVLALLVRQWICLVLALPHDCLHRAHILHCDLVPPEQLPSRRVPVFKPRPTLLCGGLGSRDAPQVRILCSTGGGPGGPQARTRTVSQPCRAASQTPHSAGRCKGARAAGFVLFCVQQNSTGQTLPSTHEGNVVTAVVTLALYQLGYTDHATHRSVCRGCPVQQPWQGPFEPNLTHLIPSHPKPNMKHMAHSELITVPGICSDTSTVPFFSGLPGSNRL